MVCTIAKRSAKWLNFLNPNPFTKRESAVSNFHTNLYGAIKSHNITAQSAPDFGHVLSLSVTRIPCSLAVDTKQKTLFTSASFLSFLLCFLGYLELYRRSPVARCQMSPWLLAIHAVEVLLRQITLDNMNIRLLATMGVA